MKGPIAMRATILLLLAVATHATASGPTPSPIPTAQFQTRTTAALNLYLDPAGNDSFSCTKADAGCLTPQGVAGKIPKLVRHPVNVYSAAGSYPGLYMYGYECDPAGVSDGAYINWAGTLTNFAPATGTATGTFSSGSQGTTITFGTATDSAQSWTSNNLKGQLLEITSGTGAGQTRVIDSNTSTAITIVGTWGTAPANGSGYAIRTHGTVLSTAINSPAIPNVAASTPVTLRMESNGSVRNSGASATALSGACITFTRMKFAPSTAATGAVRLNGPNQVAFVESSLNGNTSGTGLTTLFGSYVNVDRSFLSSGTAPALLGSSTNGGSNGVAVGFSLLESGAGVASTVVTLTNGAWTASHIRSTNSAATSVLVDTNAGSFTTSIGSSKVTCAAGGSTIGIRLGGAANVGGASSVTFVQAMAVLSCPTGIQVNGNSSLANNNANTVITGTGSQTTALHALLGGRILVPANMTISGYTNDITVDGATASWATLVGSSPIVFPASANPYGSWVGR